MQPRFSMFCPVTNQERKLPIVGLHIWIAVLSMVAVLSLQTGFAQSSSDKVHILPPSSPDRKAGQRAFLKANVDLVLVNVTVTDFKDRVVSNLRASDFSVLDDKYRQQIRYFSSEDVPFSLVVVLDSSGSMRNKFEQARSAATEFFQCSNPLDEFALIAFADRPRVLAEPDGSLSEIEPALSRVQPGGETALWDAVYLGLQRLRSARYTRKALLLISVGGDNHSGYSQREIKSLLPQHRHQPQADIRWVDGLQPHVVQENLYALTLGYGVMDNPGRYLTLLPPINGADAITGSPYFTANPGDPYKGWDTLATFDWMPRQYITFRSEFGYRHANVPYWSGRGGITPPGGNTSTLSVFGGNGGPGGLISGTTFVPGPALSATPGFTCVAGATGWCPDLRKDEATARFAIMVKF